MVSSFSLDILPSARLDLEFMRDMSELCHELRSAGIRATAVEARLPGVKDEGLTVAINAASLLLSAVGTVISVLTYWNSRKPKYTLTLQARSTTRQISQPDQAAVKAIVEQLLQDAPTEIIVRIEE